MNQESLFDFGRLSNHSNEFLNLDQPSYRKEYPMPATFHTPTNQSLPSQRPSGRKFNRKFSPDRPMDMHFFLRSFKIFYQEETDDKIRVQIFNYLDDTTLYFNLPTIYKSARYTEIKKILIKLLAPWNILRDKSQYL